MSLLTAYDGQAISYDGSGNPLSYYNGTRYTFTWGEGRRLTSAVKNGSTYTYSYDSNGIRTSKIVDGVTHNYLYASGKLLRESYGNTVLDFFYDSNGFPYALNYTVDGTTITYYYITNLQGDVCYLVDSDYKLVASYSYDPYGKVASADGTMGQINPLRYRGYYYDSETSFYYLQSRYYDPEIGRFINADSYVSTGQGFLGHNMYAYCGNNPISRVDADGQAFETVWDIVSLGASVVDVVANPTDVWAWVGLAGDAVDILIPFVGGIGEATKAIKISIKVVDGFGDLSRASEFGIKSYNTLKKLLKGTGLQAHHIIEQRLLKGLYERLGLNLGDILSVAVTASEHQKFTNLWRIHIPYGTDYSKLSLSDIWKVAQKVYAGYPELLDAAYKVLFG